MRALLALLALDEDRERRERGISLERWRDAPDVPPTRGDCEDGPRPCPHLRCKHHLGERGDGSYSCVLDFADQAAEDERTFELIGRVLGVSTQRAEDIHGTSLERAERKTAREVLILLGIRRGPTGQP